MAKNDISESKRIQSDLNNLRTSVQHAAGGKQIVSPQPVVNYDYDSSSTVCGRRSL